MSHEINIFKETGSGQVTQWPEPNPEESLLAMASQECTRGGSPCLPGMPGGEGEMCSSLSLPRPQGHQHHHSLGFRKQQTHGEERDQDPSCLLPIHSQDHRPMCRGEAWRSSLLLLPARPARCRLPRLHAVTLPFQGSYSLLFYPIW